MKPFFQKILLLCLGLIVALALAEVGLRIGGISYPVFDAYDHDRAIALKPGKEGWYYGEGRAYLKINSLGYRDVEHTKQKPPGVFRIAVLGDSFTEARQVDIGATFWKRLEAHLQGRPEFSHHRIEVLNFGIGGYGPTQEFLTLKKHVLDFSPDLVILAFCPGNDLANNSRQLISQVNRSFTPFYVLRDGQLVLDNSFRDLSIEYLQRRFLLASIHYSRILEIVNQARRVVVLRGMQQQPTRSYEIGLFDEEFLEPKNEVWKEAWRVNDAILTEMNKEVLRVGARFMLVTLTTPIQVDPDVAKREQLQRSLGVSDLFYTERRLRQLGQKLGFPVITLAERLQDAATRSGDYLHGFENSGMGTGHWNERGHQLASEILAKEVPRSFERPVDRANNGLK
jgi:hypothetical protein